MGVLVPALSRVRRFARVVAQKHQFYEIDKGIELYRTAHQDTYPDSNANDIVPEPYCGAMKLCEAMLGQDGMGLHPSSLFLASGKDGIATDACDLYPLDLCVSIDHTLYSGNLRERTPYMDPENIRANRLIDLFRGDTAAIAPFVDTYKNAVISDVFVRVSSYCTDSNNAGVKLGMPVLYYKADSSKLSHDVGNPDNSDNIYSYLDNDVLLSLGLPWDTSATVKHPMYDDPTKFYEMTKNKKITSMSKPHNADSYILISAGWDGLYGTQDDVFNFSD
jgi:hypothetical protein